MSGKLLAAAVAGVGVVDPERAVVSADDEGFSRGRAAFETLRVYGGRPFRLAEHITRLIGSAERLGLPEPSADVLRALADAALGAADAGEAVLRLYWTPGAARCSFGARARVRHAGVDRARTCAGQQLVSLLFPAARLRGSCPARSR